MNKKESFIKKHDEGYKSFFRDKKTFFEFLEEFVKKDWIGNLNENEWELIDKEFIDENLKNTESDIVYKGKIGDNEVIIYILMELQSTVDYTMPIRLLFYMTEILKNEFYNTNKNERERKDYRIPKLVEELQYSVLNLFSIFRVSG